MLESLYIKIYNKWNRKFPLLLNNVKLFKRRNWIMVTWFSCVEKKVRLSILKQSRKAHTFFLVMEILKDVPHY